MTDRATTKYVDDSTGATAESVYVMTIEGEEIGSYLGCDWTDAFIARLEKRHGLIRAEFCGGTLDGFEAL